MSDNKFTYTVSRKLTHIDQSKSVPAKLAESLNETKVWESHPKSSYTSEKFLAKVLSWFKKEPLIAKRLLSSKNELFEYKFILTLQDASGKVIQTKHVFANRDVQKRLAIEPLPNEISVVKEDLQKDLLDMMKATYLFQLETMGNILDKIFADNPELDLVTTNFEGYFMSDTKIGNEKFVYKRIFILTSSMLGFGSGVFDHSLTRTRDGNWLNFQLYSNNTAIDYRLCKVLSKEEIVASLMRHLNF